MSRVFTACIAVSIFLAPISQAEPSQCPDFLDTEIRQLHSTNTHNLCDLYREGAPLLIVNTASRCGFTEQFTELEALHQKYQERGLMVLGFPSNSFRQEEDEEADTAAVCYENYGVTFPMFEHVAVQGEEAHPVFQYLAEKTQAPRWNFNKYLLVDGVVHHYGSGVKPLDSDLEAQILMSF